MAQGQRKYGKEYKVQAVKLAKEIGARKAAKELGIPVDTLYGWQKAVREGRLDAGPREPGPCRGHESGGCHARNP
jgi:transposase